MAPNAQYVEVTIEMDDGSAHVTPMCKACANKLKPDDYEDIYLADLDQMAREEDTSKHKAPWGRLMGRRGISHKVN